jgi:tRNA-splicing ligase RtcB
VRSGLERGEVKGHMRKLVDLLFNNIPSGVGSKRKDLRLSKSELRNVLVKGAAWAVRQGFGFDIDLGYIEEQGCIQGADPDLISNRALERGKAQLGTLGSGNHFVEVGYVDEIYDESAAQTLGLFLDQVTIIVHTGSRGLGHQVCDDYIKILMQSTQKYGIELPDRQLCCAPIGSKEGRQYLAAMAGAANYAFANRQIIFHWVRETFERVFRMSSEQLGLKLIYDVCHNIAKVESHRVNDREMKVCVHRKGATRAFPPNHPDIPDAYKHVGQPVLIPGDMGRYSYVLVGTEQAMKETFGSTCHGAGRVLSRKQAKKVAKGRAIIRELDDQGITIRSAGRGTVAEEIPEAYKDVSQVVEVVYGAGISRKVARLRPMGVIKG